ncbi:MAG: glycine/betaine ABC transporter substrate-binding protein [Peptococcaceae bacterium]|nr:glycine/betaine ABC transporter substrate-binding protein [Peptococcaceae bacterium]
MRNFRWLAVALILALALGLITGCGGSGSSSEETQNSSERKEAVIDKWIFATDHEFSVRPDGLPELEETYGFQFDEIAVMDYGVTYGALKDGKVAAAMGFATDGRIGAFNLVNLVDDKKFFPVYNPAPVVRKEVLDKYPEIADVLNPIGPKLDTKTMIELNGKVDIEGMEPKEVAKEWLLEQGLIEDKEVEATKGPITVGSKQFTEQLILGQMTILALENAGFKVIDKTELGGTQVARQALEEGEIDLYWEYTGTAWLGPLGHEKAITDTQECYEKVKKEDLAKNNLVWLDYARFNNTYTIMMRAEDAKALGIKSISDLADVINSQKS